MSTHLSVCRPVQEAVENAREGKHGKEGGVKVTRVLVALNSSAKQIDFKQMHRLMILELGTAHLTFQTFPSDAEFGSRIQGLEFF